MDPYRKERRHQMKVVGYYVHYFVIAWRRNDWWLMRDIYEACYTWVTECLPHILSAPWWSTPTQQRVLDYMSCILHTEHTLEWHLRAVVVLSKGH